jgi:hypothetical protein
MRAAGRASPPAAFAPKRPANNPFDLCHLWSRAMGSAGGAAMISALFVSAALVAGWVPARRAAALPLANALRTE